MKLRIKNDDILFSCSGDNNFLFRLQVMFVVLSAKEDLFWIGSLIVFVVALFLSAIVLIFSKVGWFYQRDIAGKIYVTIRYERQALPFCVPLDQTVGELKQLAARTFHIPYDMQSASIFLLEGKIQNDEIMLRSLQIPSELQLVMSIKGGAGHFKSIPVKNLSDLVMAIKSDFDEWIQTAQPRYSSRFEGDTLFGTEVVWDGFSGSIQYYFKTNNITPYEKYVRFYSNDQRTVAVSYVWSATKILDIAGTYCTFYLQ
jgi:hypothetical protein